MSSVPQRTLFEAECLGHLERARGNGRALADALAAASNALVMAKRTDCAAQLAKVIELHRLAAARLSALERRLADGEVAP